MARCTCSGRCTCELVAGDNITIVPIGQTGYTISAAAGTLPSTLHALYEAGDPLAFSVVPRGGTVAYTTTPQTICALTISSPPLPVAAGRAPFSALSINVDNQAVGLATVDVFIAVANTGGTQIFALFGTIGSAGPGQSTYTSLALLTPIPAAGTDLSRVGNNIVSAAGGVFATTLTATTIV